MRELIVVIAIAAIAYPTAGVVNANKWAAQEMAERFENAKRDGQRIEDELRMQQERDLFAAESGSVSE